MIGLTLITVAATNVEKYLDIYFNDLGYLANELGNFKMAAGIVSLLAGIILVPIFMKIKHRLKLMSLFQIINAILVFIIFRSSANHFLLYIYTIYMGYIAIKAILHHLNKTISRFFRQS